MFCNLAPMMDDTQNRVPTGSILIGIKPSLTMMVAWCGKEIFSLLMWFFIESAVWPNLCSEEKWTFISCPPLAYVALDSKALREPYEAFSLLRNGSLCILIIFNVCIQPNTEDRLFETFYSSLQTINIFYFLFHKPGNVKSSPGNK